ncbi:MAG TPA: hypothetical protein PKC29_07535 [Thermodesulfobacteriota bacterium]|nr:hypothetical protein [Thermodesulfobacteriota bacterium]
MRKFFVVDSNGEYAGPETSAENAEIEVSGNDSAIESGLVLLLSEIARHAEEINELGNKNPVEVLRSLSEVVNRTAEFALAAGIAESGSTILAEALSKSSPAVPEAGLLHVDNGRLSVQTVINLYNGWTGPESEKGLVFGRIALCLVGMLEHTFGLIITAFSSAKIADEWSDAFTVCTGELSYAVKNVKF